MNQVTLLSFLSAFVILCSIRLTEGTSALDVDSGLYHATSRQVGAKNCSVVRIPWNLCPACKLLPFTGSGANLDFGGVNRFDIYNINNTFCRKMIRKYVDNNPCDTTRAKALDNLEQNNNPWAYKTLIYFMYSVCETCCDCIPIGSRVDQYEERKKNGTLIHILRGNCAAHVHYDTCKIWPNASRITFLNGNGSASNLTWCEDFKTWQFSNFSKGWLKNNDVDGTTWKMRRAMRMITKFGRCTEETQWKNCVNMELAQNRL